MVRERTEGVENLDLPAIIIIMTIVLRERESERQRKVRAAGWSGKQEGAKGE